MKTLYFDCFAGASGNMILGALVALGADKDKLTEQIRKLGAADFELEFKTIDKSGIAAMHAEVKVPHEHAHRHLHHIVKIINDADLSDSVKKRAVKIFNLLAEAEAKIHGISIEKIHFHEVGAMDAIVDVVGACVGFEMLGIERFVCSKIHVGSGFVKMAHGKYPVPPPAVAELLKNAPIYSTEIEGELITPTGAAIIAAVCDSYGQIPEMKIERTAYGAGTREYKDFPNALRLIIGEETKNRFYTPFETNSEGQFINSNGERIFSNNELYAEALLGLNALSEKEKSENNLELLVEYIYLLETNIDDLSAQVFGYVMDKAFEIGALDCWFTPIQMKKNRPATMVSILCSQAKKNELIKLLYAETTTLGVRVTTVERNCLPREIVKLETDFGEIDVKVAKSGDEIINAKPEYEQLREIARHKEIPLREVEQNVLAKIAGEIG